MVSGAVCVTVGSNLQLSVGKMRTDVGSCELMVLCSWGVKAGMARVWWQVKLCDPSYNTCHICAL